MPEPRNLYVYGTLQQAQAGGVVDYRGGPLYLLPADLPQEPIVVINAETGLFSLGGTTYQLVGATESGQQLVFRPADQGMFVSAMAPPFAPLPMCT